MKYCRILLILTILYLSAPASNAQFISRIVIDAGHGGKDSGAIGITGKFEKDIVLAVSLKLGKYIENNFPEVEVIYTRNTDEFIELHQRARIANNKNADLFLSLHANSAGSPHAHGTESYVLGVHRNESNLEVAKRENAVIELEDNADEHYNFDPNSPEGHIIIATKQSAYLEQSIQLANNIQKQFEERVKRHNRGVKQAGFFVLYKTTMPSILVELGFLSNEEEENYLSSSLGQDYMASAIYRAFRDYKVAMDKMYVENEEVNKTPIKKENKEGIEYKIQVYASSHKAKKDAKIYKDFKDVTLEDNGSGIFRHLVNSYQSYEEASIDLLRIVSLGYSGAYIAAYKEGNRVPLMKVTSDSN